MTPPRPVAFCCEHKNFGCRGRRPRRPGRADMESAPTTARRTSFHCHRRGGFYIRPRSLPLPPQERASPLPTNQGKQPPKSKRSTTYTCGASALGGQNDGRQPAKLARSCGSMPHWGIDRCAPPQRRPLQTNINGWHNCITTPLPIRYKLVHRTHTEYKICTSSTADAQNIHKYTRFWHIFAYLRFKKVTKTAYLLPVRGCMGYSICILSTADTQMSYGGNG